MSAKPVLNSDGGGHSISIVAVDLDDSSQLLEAVEAATPRLSPGDVARAAGLEHDPERRRRWRAARIATRIVIERAAGPSFRNVDFAIEGGGRPALGGGAPYFNVSHSGGMALVAVTRLAPVGVDVERLKRLSMSEDRRRRIVAAASRVGGATGEAGTGDLDVLKAWVRLEAVAKALGTGIGALLTEQGVIGAPGAVAGDAPLAVADLSVGAGYVAALAGPAPLENVDVISFPAGEAALAEFMASPARP